MMGWGNQGYGMWGMGWFGGLIMIFFWIIIIVGAVLVIRYFMAEKGGSPGTSDRGPLEILRERYAKGEIDTQEFEERKNNLERGG